MTRDRRVIENSGVPEYATYADLLSVPVSKGLAYVQESNSLMVSDGSRWVPVDMLNKLGGSATANTVATVANVKSNFTVATANGATVTDVTILKANGVSSVNAIKCVLPANTTPAPTFSLTRNETLQFSSDTNIPLIFPVYVDRVPVGVNIQCYPWLSDTINIGNTYRSRFTSPASFDAPGWQSNLVDKRTLAGGAHFAAMYNDPQGATGAFDFSLACASHRYTATTNATSDEKAPQFYGLSEGKRERSKVVLTFDDSKPTAYYVAYKEAKKRNICSTYFAIFDSLSTVEGDHTGMTLNQIREIANDQLCYVGLHGNAAFDGTGTGAGLDPYTEIKRNITGLKALNLSDCRYVAWPNGGMGQYVGTHVAVDQAKALGVLGGRYTLMGQHLFNGGLYNKYCIKSYPLNSNLTLAQAKAAIDIAILWGTHVTFYGHDLLAAAAADAWVASEYIELLDYIASKRSLGLIDDMRFDHFMEYGATL